MIMNKKTKIVILFILIMVISTLVYGIYYVNDYYHADENVLNLINGTDTVDVIKNDNYLFLNGSGNDTALIFYPGAKVEYTSYLPLLMNLSNSGIDCYVVEMPFNLAFFGENRADDIINNDLYNYSNWYMSGHSLGGSFASNYARNHEDNITGLILLASYPSLDIKNLSVLSIYGSNDNVLNKENYDKAKVYMPDNYTEYVINGGNHAQFGSYGKQAGDGIADITGNEQINITVKEILEFILKNK